MKLRIVAIIVLDPAVFKLTLKLPGICSFKEIIVNKRDNTLLKDGPQALDFLRSTVVKAPAANDDLVECDAIHILDS